MLLHQCGCDQETYGHPVPSTAFGALKSIINPISCLQYSIFPGGSPSADLSHPSPHGSQNNLSKGNHYQLRGLKAFNKVLLPVRLYCPSVSRPLRSLWSLLAFRLSTSGPPPDVHTTCSLASLSIQQSLALLLGLSAHIALSQKSISS